MNNDEIEEIAVHHMQGLLLGNKNLKADFATGDKKPIIDGDVSYYSPDTSRNAYFQGSVKVQIKGHEAKGKKPFKDEITHTLKREYLEGFLNHGGVTFFVVYIRRDEKKAYVRHLYPHDLLHILRDMPPEQISKNIRMAALSTDPIEIAREIHFALEAKEQRKDIVVSDEMMERVEAVTVVTPKNPDFAQPLRYGVGAEPAVIKAKLRDGNEIPIPVAIELFPEDFVFHPSGLTISAGETVFDDSLKRRISDDEFEIAVSPGLRLRLNRKSDLGKVVFTTQELLGDAKRDLDFLEAWARDELIKINDEPWRVRLNDLGDNEIVEINRQIFSRIIRLCENAEIDPNQIRVEDLTPEVLERLEPVLISIVDGQEVELNFKKTQPYDIRLGEWLLKFFAIEDSAQRGKFHGIADLDMRQLWWTDGAEESPVIERITPFEIMSAEVLSRTLNLRLKSLVTFYSKHLDEEKKVGLANECVLKLIHAADLTPKRRVEFLHAAQALNDWLVSIDGLDDVKKINRWQIQARVEGISAETKNMIREFKHEIDDDSDFGNQLRASGEILLKQFGEAKYWLDKVTEPNASDFRGRPIYTLMEKPSLLENYMENLNGRDKWSKFIQEIILEDFKTKGLHSN